MGDLNPKSVLQGILILLVLFILAYLIYDYFKNRSVEEEFEDYEYVDGSNGDQELEYEPEIVREEVKNQKVTDKAPPRPMTEKTGSNPRPVPVVKNNTEKVEHPKDCFPKDKLTPEELLPMDAANSEWAQVNPTGQGNVKNQNFLTSGYHMGINSVGSTLRNPNLQIRSEPANPREKVGPWMQSTIEPDLNRKPLEINGCE